MDTSFQLRKLGVFTLIVFQFFIPLGPFVVGDPRVQAAAQDVPETSSAPVQSEVKRMTFVSYKYIDPMTGMEAFRLLIPKGWQASGAVSWSPNPALPAQSHFRFFNPRGPEQFEIFPTQSYFWTNNRMFLTTHPPGRYRFGTLVSRPTNLLSAFNKIILPTFRGSIRELQSIERQSVPELARLAKGPPTPGVNASAEGGKIKVKYLQDSQCLEEEIYAAVSQFTIPLPGYFINYWYIDFVFSFRAAEGQLDSQSRLFQTMAFSLKVNPEWFAKVVNTKERMMQMIIKGIEAVGQMGSIIAQASSDLRADQQLAWEQREKAKDRMVQNFCDNIRGVQRYRDPFAGREVELPNNYGYAWANNLGEYVVTDSPSYNPNIGSNLHWEQIQPVP
jgi:hypothetical protein